MTTLLRTAGVALRGARRVYAPFAALLAILALSLVLGVPGVAHAQQTARPGPDTPSPDTVVARVNGTEILASDVEAALRQLPPEYGNMPPAALFNAVVDQLIDRQLVAKRARAENLQSNLEVQRTMRQLESRVLEQFYFRSLIDKKITDAALRRRYERDKASFMREKRVRARHILVKTRAEAMEIIAELRKGKDFAQLAREKSIGPSSSQGGDLGYFTREQMLPAFSAMAFSLRKGEVSPRPVQTKYGWHVIKVEDIQKAGPMTFDEVKARLRKKMSDELIEAELKHLRAGAKIERFGMDGKPLAPGAVPSFPNDAPAAGGTPGK